MGETVDIEARLERGLSLFADGRHGEAYGAVLDAVQASPGDPRLWDLLGTIALEGDHPWHAYQAYTHRRRLQDDEDAVLSQLAAAYYAIDVPAARAHAEEAASRFPDNSEARRWGAKMARIADEHDLLIDVGCTLCRQLRYADSLDLFVAAMEIRDTPAARLWLGRAFLALGQAADAAPLLESAASVLQHDPTICVDVAAAYTAGGRADIARAWLEEGARGHPGSAEVHEARARLALDQGDAVSALAAAETAIRADPDSPGAWLAAAGAREAAGHMERARIAVDRALALEPSRPDGWSLGARVVLSDGDPGLASHYQAMAARMRGGRPVETGPPSALRSEIDRLYAHVLRDPGEVRAYRDRATVNGLLGLNERALYYLDLTIRDVARGATPELLVERAGLLLRLGRFQDARASCEDALRRDPGSEHARRGLDAVIEAAGTVQPRANPLQPAVAASPVTCSCRQCGLELPTNAAFCGRCGARRE